LSEPVSLKRMGTKKHQALSKLTQSRRNWKEHEGRGGKGLLV